MTIKETLKFEQNLYNLINTCGLPVDTAFFVLKSVYLDFQKTLYEYAEKAQGGYSVEEQDLSLDNEIPKEISIDINGEKGEQADAEQ